MSKTITLTELKERIKPGDLIYQENSVAGHAGWRLWYSGKSVGLNTSLKGSFGSNDELKGVCYKTTKAILVSERCPFYLPEFLHDYDESHISDYIYTVSDDDKARQIEELIKKLEGNITDTQSQLSEAKSELEKIRRG